MSFCAAHFRLAAWTSPANASSKANTSVLISPPLSDWQRFLDERSKVAGAQRNHLVVEIVIRIVQKATSGRAALAEEHVSTRPCLEHVREVLSPHGRLVLGNHVALAEDPLADLRRELRLARAVDRRGIPAGVRDLR